MLLTIICSVFLYITAVVYLVRIFGSGTVRYTRPLETARVRIPSFASKSNHPHS
jgi:hypothetical protein